MSMKIVNLTNKLKYLDIYIKNEKMKNTNNKYLDNLVAKLVKETLEERADELTTKINKLGGMDDGHPKFGKLKLSKMSDEDLDSLMNSDVEDEDDAFQYDGDTNNKFDTEEELDESSEVCECGGGMYEGICEECGYNQMEEGIDDKEDLNGKFDYVEEEVDFEDEEETEDETESEDKEACKYHMDNFGPEDERTQQFCGSNKMGLDKYKFSINERLRGRQRNIDKNKNNKIDAEDFRMLRKESKKSKTSLKLSESEMIDLIEKIVLEDKEKTKSNIKNLTEPKGLTSYKRAFKGSGKENDDYIKSVAKKMKDYLKDGSKGDYETNPKHFPKSNGGLAKMKKIAYEVSKDGDEFLDDYMRPGMENLDYDEIHPNEDWMKDNIEGSSRTGNNPEWSNAEETELGAKLNKKRKENKYAKAKRMAANKSPQPVVTDKPGQESGKGIDIKVESIESKTDKKLNEEFEKMKSLISYDRKTQ